MKTLLRSFLVTTFMLAATQSIAQDLDNIRAVGFVIDITSAGVATVKIVTERGPLSVYVGEISTLPVRGQAIGFNDDMNNGVSSPRQPLTYQGENVLLSPRQAADVIRRLNGGTPGTGVECPKCEPGDGSQDPL